jgi:hypothetical protein
MNKKNMSKIPSKKQNETQAWTPDQYTKASTWLDNIIENSDSRIETLEKNVESLNKNIVDYEKFLSELREDLLVQKNMLDDAYVENSLLFNIKNNISVPTDSIVDSNHEKGTQTAKCIRTRSTKSYSTDTLLPKKKGRPRRQPELLSKMNSKKSEKIVETVDTESSISNASTVTPMNTCLTPVESPTKRKRRMYERNASFSPTRSNKKD